MQQNLNFWTACPFCWTQHQYKPNMLYSNVCCMNCSRIFRANALPHLNPRNVCAAMYQPQQRTGQQQPQWSGLYRFTCNRGVGGTNRDIKGRTRKPDSNPNPPSRSNASSANNIRGKRRVETVRMDASQNPNLCSELNKKRRAGEETDTGAHSAATSTPLRRSPHNNSDVKYNGNKAGFPSPAKKARVEVKGERDSNGHANATDINIDGSTSAEKEVKEEGRDKERGEMVDAQASQNPSPCSKFNLSLNVSQRRDDREETDTGAHSAGTRTHLQSLPFNKPDGKDNVTEAGLSSPANKTTVEIKEEGDDNIDANTSDINTNASTSVEEVKEQGREKEKEQVESSGLPQEKETTFKPSGSAEDKGANSRAANVGTLTVICESSQPNADAEYLYEHPTAEFYNFDMCRSCNNFQEGDIWALYSDLDTFPKYYGSICKVEHNPWKVHINWLEACPKSVVERAWLDANFPISCGKFRVTTQKTTYDNPDYFFHVVSARHHDRGNYYEILPELGEVWAIYSNWSAGWTPHDFKTCKFDIVEIIEHREESIIVWPLRQVPEFRSVFMQEEDDGTGSVTWKVSASEYILFSHKIPAILIEECGGKHKEFWGLDPASMPSAFLYHDE